MCIDGKMNFSDYEQGTDTIIPEKFIKFDSLKIIVDTIYKANNYISLGEEYARQESIKPDSSHFIYDSLWNFLSKKQKIEKINQVKNDWKDEINIRHKEYNDGKQIAWILNNTNDTVKLQNQTFRFICILEAKNIQEEWKPIQYMKRPFDNFCSSYTIILPLRANFFKFEIPKNGDYRTKLRFKILGEKRFYYSNEFEGNIEYCMFYENKFNKKRPEYKLDKFIDFVYKPR